MNKTPSLRMLENRRESRLKRLRDVGPFVTDAFTATQRTCGNARCFCAKGKEKHPLWRLTYKENGKTKSLYVPVDLVSTVSKWSKEAKWIKMLFSEVNEIQRQIIRKHVSQKRAESKSRSKVQKILGKP